MRPGWIWWRDLGRVTDEMKSRLSCIIKSMQENGREIYTEKFRLIRVGEGGLTVRVGVRDDGQAKDLLHHLRLAEGRGGVNSSHFRAWTGVVGCCVMDSCKQLTIINLQ